MQNCVQRLHQDVEAFLLGMAALHAAGVIAKCG